MTSPSDAISAPPPSAASARSPSSVPRELPHDVTAGDVRPGLEVERPDILDEGLQGPRITLHERDVRRPARERLEPDAARAGEQIEHARIGQPGPERIHQRDPDLIGCRPRRGAPWRHQPPPLQRSGDHTHADRTARSTERLRFCVMSRGRYHGRWPACRQRSRPQWDLRRDCGAWVSFVEEAKFSAPAARRPRRGYAK